MMRGHSTPGEPTLFDDVPRARTTDPATSKAADRANKEYSRNSQCGKILLALAALGEANGDEIDKHWRWRWTTAGRRICEVIETGYVEKTGSEHPTQMGQQGYCVRLTEKGRQWVKKRFVAT